MATGVLRVLWRGALIATIVAGGVASSVASARADALLDEIVNFTGQVFILDTKVPAVVIGAIRDGQTSVRGFGERADQGSAAPEGDTILRLGSITKAFTGEMLAHLTADGTVQLAQPLAKWAPDLTTGASSDAQRIRLIDLATHAGGLPREVAHEPGPDDDPFATITREAFAAWLKQKPLLFRPARPSSIPISASTCWPSPCPKRGRSPIPSF